MVELTYFAIIKDGTGPFSIQKECTGPVSETKTCTEYLDLIKTVDDLVFKHKTTLIAYGREHSILAHGITTHIYGSCEKGNSIIDVITEETTNACKGKFDAHRLEARLMKSPYIVKLFNGKP